MASKSNKSRSAAQQQRPNTQVSAAASGATSPPSGSTTPKAASQAIDTDSLKLELLASLRQEIADIFKTEIRAALGDDLSTIKADLINVKISKPGLAGIISG